jgi:hypothetical protein
MSRTESYELGHPQVVGFKSMAETNGRLPNFCDAKSFKSKGEHFGEHVNCSIRTKIVRLLISEMDEPARAITCL